jgi:hypothetical protein
MADLDTLDVRSKELNNLNKVVVPALKEGLMTVSAELSIAKIENQTLTAKLNDCEANERALKRKRIWWGVGGVVAGALTYSYLTR